MWREGKFFVTRWTYLNSVTIRKWNRELNYCHQVSIMSTKFFLDLPTLPARISCIHLVHPSLCGQHIGMRSRLNLGRTPVWLVYDLIQVNLGFGGREKQSELTLFSSFEGKPLNVFAERYWRASERSFSVSSFGITPLTTTTPVRRIASMLAKDTVPSLISENWTWGIIWIG